MLVEVDGEEGVSEIGLFFEGRKRLLKQLIKQVKANKKAMLSSQPLSDSDGAASEIEEAS